MIEISIIFSGDCLPASVARLLCTLTEDNKVLKTECQCIKCKHDAYASANAVGDVLLKHSMQGVPEVDVLMSGCEDGLINAVSMVLECSVQ